jgi:hypothetical protein
MDAETAECSSGEREKCRARRHTTTLRRPDIEVAELLVKDAKPAQRENGKLKRAAELIAFFGRVEQATAEHGLALIWPFIPPLVCELLTIVFLHLAFAGACPLRRRPARSETVAGTVSGESFQIATVSGKVSRPANDDLEAVLSALRSLGRSATNAEFAAIMGCSEGEASKRAKACGPAVMKERAGRTVRSPQRLHRSWTTVSRGS